MRLRSLLLLALCLWMSSGMLAQEKKGQSTVTCVNCHEAQALPQPDTQMGRALQLPHSNLVLNAHTNLTFRKGQYSYSVQTHEGKSQYTVSDGTQTVTIPILWSMGAQAQTWMLERNGQLYESLVSYYPSINGLDITTGDERLTPNSIEEAIGRPTTDQDAKVCFNCHATNAVMNHKLNLTSLKPGVTCEHCHTEASAHLAAMMGESASMVIPKRLGKLSSEDMGNYCGQCHRTWETVVRSHWRGEANVRFQPYRLANSRCFNGADPRISCVACHNPHEQVVRESTYYDEKCLACHAPLLKTAASTPPHAKACPVAKSNCVSCHMPKVALPNGHLRFTDHQIRVVKANELYPN